jgi:two-component system, NarL family, response regulator DegU
MPIITLPNPVRVLVADDHPVVRLGLQHLLGQHDHFKVVGLAANGLETLQLAATVGPHLVLLDVDMPGPTVEAGHTWALVASLRQTVPGLRVIIFTAYNNEEVFNQAISAGVEGFISKENLFDDLMEGLQAVARGQQYYSPMFSSFLHRRLQAQRVQQLRDREKATLDNQLTRTEKRVLRLVAESKTSHQIADELFVSVKTVDNHRTHICKKLGLQGKNSLLKFALEHRAWWEHEGD